MRTIDVGSSDKTIKRKVRVAVKERNLSVDVLRGIGILLVVSGHASSGSSMNVFAPYSFHMPLFFFISGLFFSDSKVDGVLSTIVKNTKSLLLYSTAFYIFYAGVCWVITRLGFTAFSQPFSLELIFLNQFTTSGAYRFTAAYWFIPCLFFVKLYFSLIHVRLISLIKSRREGLVSLSFLAAYMAIAFAAVVYSVEMYEQKGVQLDKIIYYRFAFALFFFYLGSIVSKYKVQRIFSNIFVLAVLYIVQQQLWASAGNLDFWMQVSKYQATYLPVISSVLAIAFFYGLSDIAARNKSFSVVLGYVGENSLPIVLHHIFGFFLINALLCVFGVIKPSDVINQYYQFDTVHTWPFYIIGGVLFSLVFDRYAVRPLMNAFKNMELLSALKRPQ